MPDSKSCLDSAFLFTEGKDGTWELMCEGTGEVLVIFETRVKAVDFAESLMDDEGPWRIVFRRD